MSEKDNRLLTYLLFPAIVATIVCVAYLLLKLTPRKPGTNEEEALSLLVRAESEDEEKPESLNKYVLTNSKLYLKSRGLVFSNYPVLKHQKSNNYPELYVKFNTLSGRSLKHKDIPLSKNMYEPIRTSENSHIVRNCDLISSSNMRSNSRNEYEPGLKNMENSIQKYGTYLEGHCGDKEQLFRTGFKNNCHYNEQNYGTYPQNKHAYDEEIYRTYKQNKYNENEFEHYDKTACNLEWDYSGIAKQPVSQDKSECKNDSGFLEDSENLTSVSEQGSYHDISFHFFDEFQSRTSLSSQFNDNYCFSNDKYKNYLQLTFQE